MEAERKVGALARAVRFALARQHDAERLGQSRLHVSHKLDEVRAREALVLLPRLHHRAVVDAVDDDFVDAERLEVRLLLKVPWHLPRGSGGGECARQ